jgi:hypothetical protein
MIKSRNIYLFGTILIASSPIYFGFSSKSLAGSCSNNGHGNNADIVITLPTGLQVLLEQFDPSNPGNGGKIDRVIRDSNPGILQVDIEQTKSIILAGNYDYETRGNSRNSGCKDDFSGLNDDIIIGSPD